MSKIKVNHYVVGAIQTNCYLVINTENNEAIIIDPGDMAEALHKKIQEEGVKLVAILLTHGHFDHAMAAEKLATLSGDIPIYIHEKEKDTLLDPELNVSYMMGGGMTFKATDFLKDEQEIDIAGIHIRVLLTPGHTPGGCCYYLPYEEVVFSGDSLFAGSIGRTDFKGGSMRQLVDAVKNKLMILPENTTVYPGHNDITTIENERMYNPYL